MELLRRLFCPAADDKVGLVWKLCLQRVSCPDTKSQRDRFEGLEECCSEDIILPEAPRR